MVTPTRHNARAAGAVVLAMAAITASDALVKGLLEEIKASQFIFVRALVILLILGVVLVLNNQRIPLPSLRKPWSLVRGGCELLATSLWLLGLQFIALPTAAALAWTSPIMVTLLGIVILREANSLWRWVAVLIGFIGVLCVTRPWGTEWSLLLLLPVATAAASALRCTSRGGASIAVTSAYDTMNDPQASAAIGAYRTAPPGFRIWCGPTVEASDLEALMQLGFEEAACRAALTRHGGDRQQAEDWLLSN